MWFCICLRPPKFPEHFTICIGFIIKNVSDTKVVEIVVTQTISQKHENVLVRGRSAPIAVKIHPQYSVVACDSLCAPNFV